MSTTTTTSKFDLARLVRAHEERDAATQLSMYADDATVTIADKDNTPSSPQVLSGREQIKGWIDDVTSRDMTHKVGHVVADDSGAAFVVSCRYSDGTQVVCSTVIELAGDAIARQSVVQAWDAA